MSQLEALVVKPLNHVLAGSPWALERLRHHAGAHVRLRAGALLGLDLCIDGHGFFQAAQAHVEPDVDIELADDFPARLLLERDTLMASTRLSGSADVAETLAFVFRNLRWDIEGDLAAVLGDIPARRLSLAGSSLLNEVRTGAGRLSGNLAEYACEEAKLLVAQPEVGHFLREVDVLRDEMARLEKRIARLGG